MYVYLQQPSALFILSTMYLQTYHLPNTNIMMLTSTPYYPSIICLWSNFYGTYLFMQYIQVSTTIQRSVLLVVI